MGATSIALGLSNKSLIVIVAAVLMLMGLNYFVNATKTGRAIRAVAQDRATASLMGVNVNRIISMTFLVGGALGGAAGLLFALKFTRIDAFVGFYPGLKAFTAAVLGGIGISPVRFSAGSFLECWKPSLDRTFPCSRWVPPAPNTRTFLPLQF